MDNRQKKTYRKSFSRDTRKHVCRVPKSIAWNDLYQVPCGKLKGTIAPGQRWIKRRVCIYKVETTANGSVTVSDLWNAICCGAGESGASNVKQPYTLGSVFSVRIRSFHIFAQINAAFKCQFLESTIMQSQSSDSKSLKTFETAPNSTVDLPRLAVKIPTPQQLEFPVSSSDTNQIMNFAYPEISATNYPMHINVSLMIKI